MPHHIVRSNEEYKKLGYEYFKRALWWSLMTTLLAIGVIVAADTLIQFGDHNGLVNHENILNGLKKSEKFFGITIALVSAVIVEYWFSIPDSSNKDFDYKVLFGVFAFLFVLTGFSSLHHFHDKEYTYYKETLKKADDLQNEIRTKKSLVCKDTFDVVINRRELVKLDTANMRLWNVIEANLKDENLIKVNCLCLKLSVFSLLLSFIASVLIRTRMQILKVKIQP